MKFKLMEEMYSGEIHLYGNPQKALYYWDGSKYVELSPAEKEKYMKAYIDQQTNTDEPITPEQREEEKARLERIKGETSKENIKKVTHELKGDKRARQQKAADEYKKLKDKNKNKSDSVESIVSELKDFVKLTELKQKNTKQKPSYIHQSWQTLDRSLMKAGRKRDHHQDENITRPTVYIYFDRSGSWKKESNRDTTSIGYRKTQKGNEIVRELLRRDINNTASDLKKPKDRVLDVRTFFFSDQVYDNEDDAAHSNSTCCADELLEHMINHKPDNVIIMTDRDPCAFWNGIPSLKYTAPGYVWGIFVGESREMAIPYGLIPEALTGAAGYKTFYIEMKR